MQILIKKIVLSLQRQLCQSTIFNFKNMEVRVYKDVQDYGSRKAVLVQRISDNSQLSFPYDSCVRTFKSLFGVGCVIEFVVL